MKAEIIFLNSVSYAFHMCHTKYPAVSKTNGFYDCKCKDVKEKH